MAGCTRTRTRFCALLALFLAGCTSVGPRAGDSDAPEPDEINVGYGTLSAQHITGSVAHLDMDDVDRSSISRVGDLLEGRFAGVNVRRTRGGEYNVIVRGISSFYGTNEPLYVVDGVELRAVPGQGPPELNPADIASIVVLKDAGAAAIYGSRGANGVIIITTKRSLN